jgi:hypothetical protein
LISTQGKKKKKSLKRSVVLRHHVKVRQLHENMRVQMLLAQDKANAAADAQQQQAWADYLQRIREGTLQRSAAEDLAAFPHLP